uniref:T6SS Phospholipase effector Tle1-like catalytic domain-containing protein n=2 Tax=unclassified Phormidium TaxID=2609805 RepID=A0A2P1CZG2_9CYAN
MGKEQLVLTLDDIDDYLKFSQDFPLIQTAITIEFWAKGGNSLEEQTSVVEAYNAKNNRVVNINLPWKCTDHTRIFWDAGNENGYDRIDKAVNLNEYNVWTHWAFVKDASIGKMYIYRNGDIWHEGEGKNKSLTGIKKFVIGSLVKYSNYWKGSLAEFRIWHQARTKIEIEENMNFSLVGNEPGLSAYLPLNGDVNDKSSYNNNAIIYGTTWSEEVMSIRKNKPKNQQENQPVTEGENLTEVTQEDATESSSIEETEQPMTAIETSSTGDEQTITIETSSSPEGIEQQITTIETSSTGESEQTITTIETSSTTEGIEQEITTITTSYPEGIEQIISAIASSSSTEGIEQIITAIASSSLAGGIDMAGGIEQIISAIASSSSTEGIEQIISAIASSSTIGGIEQITTIESSSPGEVEQITTTIELSSPGEVEQIITAIESSSPEGIEQIITAIESSSPEEIEQIIIATGETEPIVIATESSATGETEQPTIAVNENEQSPQSPVVVGKKKRLVVCCDGTWHELTSAYPTNVLKLARLVKYTADDQTPQLVFYSSGSSREDVNIPDLIDRLGDSAFRWGIDRLIQDAYRFLCMNYDPDSQDEIYLFGFSRGAYIVRCLAGMIYKCGLLRRSKIQEIRKAYELYRHSEIAHDSLEAQEFRQENSKKLSQGATDLENNIPIKMLGCWETVGTLGIPDVLPLPAIEKIWNINYQFYDATLSPIVENGFHAVAIDEKRQVFPSTPLKKNEKNPNQVVEEVWFAGEHSCVGGGNKDYRGLSDYALQWMLQKAQNLGLEFYSTENDSEDFQIKPDPTTYFDNTVEGVYLLRGEGWRSIHSSRIAVHSSVVKRLKACPDYRPENLKSVIPHLLVSE